MNFSVLYTIISSSLLFKFIIVFFVFLLVWEIMTFVEKLGVFKVKLALSESFKSEFNSGEMLDQIYNRLAGKKKIYSPLARIFFVGMKELNMSNIKTIDFGKRYSDAIKVNMQNRIYSSMSIERSKIIYELKKNLSRFVMFGSTAPIFGIFGSVWEIMYTFYSINTSKIINLSDLIPGIAQSLISIIASLIVMLVSVFCYNYLVNILNDFIEDTEVFTCDLTNILARELDSLTNSAVKRSLMEQENL